MYPYHYESVAQVEASAGELFEFIDDHARLSSHMSKSSWMMGGGSMTVEADNAHGKVVGSVLTLRGTALGIPLEVVERVTERQPPFRKVWETIDQPKLLIIGVYQMGFEIKPANTSLTLRVFINYSLPIVWWQRWLGVLFAKVYAHWCTVQMANDAAKHFASRTNITPITTTKRA